MAESPEQHEHHCPGCGAAQRLTARYPWHFCNGCLNRAVDAKGRALVFGNASFSGGLSWAYADDREARDDSALRVICLIAGRPVLVHEARFGGVVAEPLASHRPLDLMGDRNTVDLGGRGGLDRARARLARGS